jgi:DNA mismatch repair protein MutS
VPAAVIRAARRHLARLESQAVDSASQLDLFAPPPCLDAEESEPAAPQADSLRALLASIDPDSLTPREALERLYELKRTAS